ncbi:MAG: mechanosensitive ion channel family protein [Campylobacter sp.]|nr:mechanosensitive ion channel family protein [Campylobacter sp.]
MKKFIMKFFLTSCLIFSLNLGASEENLADFNVNDTNLSHESKTSTFDVNVSSLMKQPRSSEENKTAEKERIVELLKVTDKDTNISQENQMIIEMVAEKTVSSEFTASKTGKRGIYEILGEIKDINFKIELLSQSSADENATNTEIKLLESSKNALYLEIPAAITSQVIDENRLMEYLTIKKDIKAINEKFKNRPKSFEYINSTINLSIIELSETFYGAILMLEKMFANGASDEDIKDAIKDPLFKIQVKNLTNIKEAVGNFENERALELKDKYLELAMYKKSYGEVLDFLNKNRNLLSSSVLFTGLNIKSVIDYINKISPFEASKINLGKIIPIVFIMAFLFSIRRFLAQIIYMIFNIFIRDKSSGKEIKTQVVRLIQRPMGALLIAYGVDICTSIFYYSSPVPIVYASIFGVVYVVLYAWLTIRVIDGFGVMIISKIARKSSRKEVLNLVVRLLYVVVFVVAIVLVLSNLGVNVSAIMASLGIGGIAIALATKDMIANLFASIMVLFDNSFSQGDWIEVAGAEGTVVEIGLRKTTIRTFDNALIFVPNSEIIAGNIKNWSRRKVGRQIKMYLEIGYNTTTKQLKTVTDEIKQMLIDHPGIAKPASTESRDLRFRYRQNIVSIDDLAGYKSTLFVTVDSFEKYSINIMIYSFSKSVVWGEFLDVKQDVMLKIMEILEKNNVEFALPSSSIKIDNSDNAASIFNGIVDMSDGSEYSINDRKEKK